ncbi:MAG: hypothetical protein JXR53_02960 [Bacteroidales bacterium]|nr:hypothetical protein [Bacteroidales bacterium]
MLKIYFTLFSLFFASILSIAQDCDCLSNFEWVKKTFEENDAGFEYAIRIKGEQAYIDHNERILEKVKKAETLYECTPVLYEWLTFFRSGHIAVRISEEYQLVNNSPQTFDQFPDWETYNIDTESFQKYLDGKEASDYEGIWLSEPYTIGIKKVKDEYIGFIIESGLDIWPQGQIKLRFTIDGNNTNAVFYMRNHLAVESKNVSLLGMNYLQIGNFYFKRLYPELENEPIYDQYFRMLDASLPYVEQLDSTTLYFRIPSFYASQKHAIDSVIEVNRGKILQTENLIIDIRSGTGGSDMSYSELLPILYTNPIREVGVEYLSTPLNNQRMLDFINNVEYGFDEEDKIWAQAGYDTLSKHLGEFVNLDSNVVGIITFDTVYPYPRNIGIIINQQNGSTDEQFLLAAKQSKKVKLFGTTTYGVLDISNMYFVTSPCGEFELGYSLSRSMRIPGFTIDGKGIQPDYFLDRSIPFYSWTTFVKEILEAQ